MQQIQDYHMEAVLQKVLLKYNNKKQYGKIFIIKKRVKGGEEIVVKSMDWIKEHGEVEVGENGKKNSVN
jgi:hypothetical protein